MIAALEWRNNQTRLFRFRHGPAVHRLFGNLVLTGSHPTSQGVVKGARNQRPPPRKVSRA